MAKAAGLKLKTPIKLAPAKPVEAKSGSSRRRTHQKFSMEDKIETASSINKATLGYDKRVKSCTIDYLDLTGTDYFGNSEGSFIEQDKLFVWSRITASALQNGVFTFSGKKSVQRLATKCLMLRLQSRLVGNWQSARLISWGRSCPKAASFRWYWDPTLWASLFMKLLVILAEADLGSCLVAC